MTMARRVLKFKAMGQDQGLWLRLMLRFGGRACPLQSISGHVHYIRATCGERCVATMWPTDKLLWTLAMLIAVTTPIHAPDDK